MSGPGPIPLSPVFRAHRHKKGHNFGDPDRPPESLVLTLAQKSKLNPIHGVGGGCD